MLMAAIQRVYIMSQQSRQWKSPQAAYTDPCDSMRVCAAYAPEHNYKFIWTALLTALSHLFLLVDPDMNTRIMVQYLVHQSAMIRT